jgi:hypothetical protein
MVEKRIKSTEKYSICNWFIESTTPNNTIVLTNNGNIPGSSYFMTVQFLSLNNKSSKIRFFYHYYFIE